MNDWLLKAKNWQVWLLLTLFNVAAKYFASDALITGCFSILFVAGFVGWLAVLGNTLYQYLPWRNTYSLSWFLIDALLLIVAHAFILIFFDGSLEVHDLAALLGFYLCFAVGHLVWFPAVVLLAIENRATPAFSHYAGTLLQLLFWPIGIWFIQPRLNRLHDKIQAGSLVALR